MLHPNTLHTFDDLLPEEVREGMQLSRGIEMNSIHRESSMNVGIIGGGVVGRAYAAAYTDHVSSVRIHDNDPKRSSHTLEEVLACDLIFLCLPTPQKSDSLECDTSIIESVCKNLSQFKPNGNYVIRSTVPIGFTRRMRDEYGLVNLVHSPEFLTARTAEHDAGHPTRLIIGGEICECRTQLCRLYDKIWPEVNKFVISSDESESVKLFQNSFSAVKIALFNEFRCLTDKLGLNWQLILDALLAGGWINPMHTQVPGPDGKYGFGGACLKKDLANLIFCIRRAGCEDYVADAALERNNEIDRKKTPQ